LTRAELGDGTGGDIVVFTGTACRADDIPPPHERPAPALAALDQSGLLAGAEDDQATAAGVIIFG
jgi:hypothetical protein